MRILGAVLLIAGFLLCLSIVWAAIGFLAMGLGLICLLIAERRQERIKQLPPAIATDVGLDRLEVAQPIPKQEVASSAMPSELPEAQQHPLHSVGSGSPILSQRSERRPARRTVTAARRSFDAERQHSIAKDGADIPRLVNVTKSSGMAHADQLAATDPELHDTTSRPAAIGLDPFRGSRDAARETVNPGDPPGSVPSGGRSDTSNQPLTSPPPRAAATRESPSREALPNRQEVGAARGPPGNHSAGAGSRLAGGWEQPATATSAKGESVPRRPTSDAEDVRNLSELLSKIGRPRPDAERG